MKNQITDKKKYLSDTILFLLLISTIAVISSCNRLSKENLTNNTDSLSYYMGIYTGWTLREAGVKDLNKEMLDSAIRKVFAASDTGSSEFMLADKIIASYIQKGRNIKTLEEGREFLSNNKKSEGVITTESGLQYLRLNEGKGRRPEPGDSIVFRLTGYTLDGQVFMNLGNDAGEPYEMLLNEGTKGGLEALQLMKEGSKYKFYLPTELAYGLNPLPGGIVKPNMALIYEIELLSVIPQKK